MSWIYGKIILVLAKMLCGPVIFLVCDKVLHNEIFANWELFREKCRLLLKNKKFLRVTNICRFLTIHIAFRI